MSRALEGSWTDPQRFAARTVLSALLTLLLLAVSATAASAADRYLAPTGVNSGGCTLESAPCSSLSYVQSQVAGGDTVNFAVGTYLPDTNYLNIPNITYKGPQAGVAGPGQTGPEARILVAAGGFAFIVQADGMDFDGLTFTSEDAGAGNGSFGIYNVNPVSLRNLRFTNMQTGIYAEEAVTVARTDLDTTGDAMLVDGTGTVTDTRFHPAGSNAGLVSSASGPVTVTGSTFESGDYGFLTYLGPSPATLTGNRFSPSIANALYNEGTPVDARNNWWGCNGGANTSGCASVVGPGAGVTTTQPRLVLTATANPTRFTAPGSTTITADLLHNSAGAILTHGPNGSGIALATDHGTLTDEHPSLVDGAVTSTLDVTAASSPIVTASLDNETATASVEVTGKPTNTVRPTVSNSGGVLTAAYGTWEGSPTGYSYAWQRCSGSPTACTAITGTTDADDGDSTYTLTGDDTGARLRVRVTATNAIGPAYALSLAGAVVGSKPVSTSRPSITGTPRRGQTLTADPGSWNNNPSSYSYTWQRCSGSPSVCTTIAGEHDSTYTLTDDDQGARMRVRVSATNPAGTTTSGYSLLTATVGAKPASTARPAITGTPQAGPTLTTDVGGWDNDPTSYRETWQRCSGSPTVCTTITSADATNDDLTYTPVGDDVGKRLRVSITAGNAFGSKTSAYSLLTSTVRACDC